MRTGVGTNEAGSAPLVYWAGSGRLHHAYSGKVLADFYGVDVAHGEWISSNCCRQYSRKIFWFTPVGSEEVMTEYEGKKVSPILYDAQVFEFTTTNGQDIMPLVVSSTRNVPVSPITWTWVPTDDREYSSETSSLETSLENSTQQPPETSPSNTILFHAPVFVNLPEPISYQAWEFYDYHVDPTFIRPPSAVWTRQGSTLPFCEEQRAVLRFVGRRYERLEDLPEMIRDRLVHEYPLYQRPPRDMEEVEALQKKREES